MNVIKSTKKKQANNDLPGLYRITWSAKTRTRRGKKARPRTELNS